MKKTLYINEQKKVAKAVDAIIPILDDYGIADALSIVHDVLKSIEVQASEFMAQADTPEDICTIEAYCSKIKNEVNKIVKDAQKCYRLKFDKK